MEAWLAGLMGGANAATDIAAAQMSADSMKQNSEANREFAYNMFKHNEALQKEFAQNGIRWRIQDAEQSGIHPLAALGAQTHSFSPVAVDGGSGGQDTSIGPGLANMGQNISRAMSAMMTQDEKRNELLTAQINSVNLDNEMKSMELQRLSKMHSNSPGNPKGLPSMVSEKPLEKITSDTGYSEPGAVNDLGWVRTAGGGIAPVPSKDAKERTEDNVFQEAAWAIRNNFLPAFKGLPSPDPKTVPLPKGYDRWKWQPALQEFRPWKNIWDDRSGVRNMRDPDYKKTFR